MLKSPDGEQGADRLHHVARPYQMITVGCVGALIASLSIPWGDEQSDGIGLVLMGQQ